MSGWQANGHTNPRWRSCAHALAEGRCTLCHARHWAQFEQSSHASLGGVPIGSALLVLPKLVNTGAMGPLAAYPGGFIPGGRAEQIRRGSVAGHVAQAKARRK
jgi:hypothetical protein